MMKMFERMQQELIEMDDPRHWERGKLRPKRPKRPATPERGPRKRDNNRPLSDL
jgi:hypothetical protein